VAQEAIANPDTDAQAAGDEPVTALTDPENVQMVEVTGLDSEGNDKTEVEDDEILAALAANPDADLSELRKLVQDN
jgi:hypothetical protein